jgi:hypothetical protein
MANYEIRRLVSQERDFSLEVQRHFVDFFNNHDYTISNQLLVTQAIETSTDIDRLPYGSGLYLILTDHEVPGNLCRFEHDRLRAIYRGHCSRVKARVRSHLFNAMHRAGHHEGPRFETCIRLEGKNLNIDQEPHSRSRWMVMVHKMTGSSRLIREQAELAFDAVYGRPAASRER